MTARAITSLAQYEDRLRRALGLVGEVGLYWQPDLRPVFIAGNASDPGCSSLRGRRFAAAVNMAPGAGWSFQVKATADVVITRYAVQATGVGIQIALRIVSPDVVDPFAISTLFAPFTERAVTANDLAPLARSALPAAASSDGTFISTWATNAVPSPLIEAIRQPVMLQTGAKLNLQSPNVATPVFVIIEGYVF